MNVIAINNTAARSSGALTILKDCLAFIESIESNENEYHLMTTVDLFDCYHNINIHKIKKQNWLTRILWDSGGFQRYCNKNDIAPDIIISLQNTSMRYLNKRKKLVTQVVYYHQSLPLVKYNWNIFKKEEILLFLYAHFYSYFVIRNNLSSHYVVQLPYIRELFLKKYKNILPEKISVIRPNIPKIDIDRIDSKKKEPELVTFFYPATALRHKNHKILIDALVYLKERRCHIINNIQFIFTIDILPKELQKKINKYGLDSVIKFIGIKSYDEILSYYKSVDILLFPSIIETVGLPLIEAACFGLPIITSNLQYSHDVLAKYNNVCYADPYQKEVWAEYIMNSHTFKKGTTLLPEETNSWQYFFSIVDSLIRADKTC